MNYKLESTLLGEILTTSDGRKINNLRYADDSTLMAQSEKELKSFLRVKEESEKAGLKLNIQKTEIMASSPITSWQIHGQKMKTETDFIFLGSKSLWTAVMTLKEACSLGRKAMMNLDSVLKSRDINLSAKGPYSQS